VTVRRRTARRVKGIVLGLALLAAGWAVAVHWLDGGEAPEGVTGTVVKVTDGDTITIADDQGKTRVRLLGIDAPELAHNGQPAACGADAARDRLAELLPLGTTVTITLDPRSDPVDRYGRVLGRVAADGLPDAALAMIELGMVEAWVPAGEPDPERQGDYREAEAQARANQVGSWAVCDDLGR
jgi:micrococcal nuclease